MTHPFRDKKTGHMRHPRPLLLTTPSMLPRKRRRDKIDALKREIESLSHDPANQSRIQELQLELDERQRKMNKLFNRSFFPQ